VNRYPIPEGLCIRCTAALGARFSGCLDVLDGQHRNEGRVRLTRLRDSWARQVQSVLQSRPHECTCKPSVRTSPATSADVELGGWVGPDASGLHYRQAWGERHDDPRGCWARAVLHTEPAGRHHLTVTVRGVVVLDTPVDHPILRDAKRRATNELKAAVRGTP